MNDAAEELEKILIGACNGEDYHPMVVDSKIGKLKHVWLQMPSPRLGTTEAFGIPCGASFHDGARNILFDQGDGPDEYIVALSEIHERMANWVWPLSKMKTERSFTDWGKPVMPWFSLHRNLRLLDGEARNPRVHKAFSLVQTYIGFRDMWVSIPRNVGRSFGEKNAKPWLDLLHGSLLWECDLLPKWLGEGSKLWTFRLRTNRQLILEYNRDEVIIDAEDYKDVKDLKDKVLAAKEEADKNLPFLS